MPCNYVSSHEWWSLVYLHAMRIMPCHATCHHMCTNTDHVMCASYHTHVLASWLSLDIYDSLEVTYWHDVCMSQMTSTKIHHFTFFTLDNKNANENILKRILIAMHNENKTNFNENFRTYSQEPIAQLYKW